MVDSKDRCSTCDYYNLSLGLCQLPNLPAPGIARAGSYHCGSWKPYKKSCQSDCSGDCEDCTDCTCDSKPKQRDLSLDDICRGKCGGCNSSCKDDDSTNDPADLYWPIYGNPDD